MNKYKVQFVQKESFIVDVYANNQAEAELKATTLFDAGCYEETGDCAVELDTVYDVTNTDDHFYARNEDEVSFKLVDRQGMGTFSTLTFNTLDEVREQLVSYHSIDWSGENDINDLSLNDLLDYGDWELEVISKEEAHYCNKGEHTVYGNGNVDLLEDNTIVCHECKNK